ncbi:MAG: hypothetical protein V2B18_17590 [Pseudomonadota bacterium]
MLFLKRNVRCEKKSKRLNPAQNAGRRRYQDTKTPRKPVNTGREKTEKSSADYTDYADEEIMMNSALAFSWSLNLCEPVKHADDFSPSYAVGLRALVRATGGSLGSKAFMAHLAKMSGRRLRREKPGPKNKHKRKGN